MSLRDLSDAEWADLMASDHDLAPAPSDLDPTLFLRAAGAAGRILGPVLAQGLSAGQSLGEPIVQLVHVNGLLDSPFHRRVLHLAAPGFEGCILVPVEGGEELLSSLLIPVPRAILEGMDTGSPPGGTLVALDEALHSLAKDAPGLFEISFPVVSGEPRAIRYSLVTHSAGLEVLASSDAPPPAKPSRVAGADVPEPPPGRQSEPQSPQAASRDPHAPSPQPQSECRDPLQADRPPLVLIAEVGRAPLSLADVMSLDVGTEVLLDQPAGQLVDLVVAGRVIARGEVIVAQGQMAVRIAEVLSGEDILEYLETGRKAIDGSPGERSAAGKED